MAGKQTAWDGEVPDAQGTPEEAQASTAVAPNFDHARMMNFLKDWKATKGEIKDCKERYLAPLTEHLKDSRKLAKEAGFNLKVMDEILADMELSPSDYEDVESVRDLYRYHAQQLLKKDKDTNGNDT